MEESVRVLEFFGEPLANGGQESFIMNMYRNIDRSKVQFDFFTPYSCSNEKLREEICSLGGNVYESDGEFGDNKGNKKDFIKNSKKFFKTHKYEIVHIHSGSIFSLAWGAKIAKKSGANKVIVHSHCTGVNNFKYKIIKTISAPIFLKNVDKYYACSEVAAEWKFPKKIIAEKKYTILKNAIDTGKIYFDESVREEIRKKINLSDKFVVGHIGRFSYQKNHEFLIDVFNEICKYKENAVLLLVGVGELQNKIRNKVKELNLGDRVMFLDIRKDIQELLNAMDVFVLPSYFEGLPVVGVEAQAAGLQVFTSDNITKELPLKELVFYYSLEMSASEWSENIIKEFERYARTNTTDKIIEAGFDVKVAANKMQKLYIDIAGK